MGLWKKPKYRKNLKALEAAALAQESDGPMSTEGGATDSDDGASRHATADEVQSSSSTSFSVSSSLSKSSTYKQASVRVGITGWTWKERKVLVRYLNQYKLGCESYYAGLDPAMGHTSREVIGEVEFPILNEKVFSEPYLCLPTTLTSKNRKMVHECCAECFLFHTSIGERSKRNRTLAISIYANGFQFLPTKSSATPTVRSRDSVENGAESEGNSTSGRGFYHPPIHQFRPWFRLVDRPWHIQSVSPEALSKTHTNGNPPHVSSSLRASKSTETNGHTSLDQRGKSLVDELIDNPEKCLREELDDMDFARWDKVDLSDIPLPTASAEHNGNKSGRNSTTPGWTLVDSATKMKACVAELSAACPTEIGFDLESLNTSKYTQLTSLLQITSNSGHDYVIDPLAPGVWDLIGPGLAPFFANPNIVKVGHSIGGLDVRSLHRDFGIFVVNVFDTYEAAQVLGLESHGLASVCKYYGLQDPDRYKQLKAEYQATDWRRRPLTKPMLEYGRYDVHYLLRLRMLMIRDLTRTHLYDRNPTERDEEAHRVASSMASALAQFRDEEEEEEGFGPNNTERVQEPVDVLQCDNYDNTSHHDKVLSSQNPIASVALLRMQPNLMKVISLSQERCRDLWSGRPEPFLTHSIYIQILHRARRGELAWTPAHLKLYEQLMEWRKRIADEREILPGFVAPVDFLIHVALQCPVSYMALQRVSFRLPELVEEDPSCRESLLDVIRKTISINRGSDKQAGLHENGNEPILRYKSPDIIALSQIRLKHKSRNREPQKHRQEQTSRHYVDWTIAAAMLVAMSLAVVAFSRPRWT